MVEVHIRIDDELPSGMLVAGCAHGRHGVAVSAADCQATHTALLLEAGYRPSAGRWLPPMTLATYSSVSSRASGIQWP